jgi:7-cyano-7-deazaguanine synthase in queuosine biosynthesis
MRVEIHLFSTKRQKDGLALLRVRVPDLGVDYELDLPFKALYERCSVPDGNALDFLITASLCYLIDKIVPRNVATDNWTRMFEVDFPVSDPKAWANVTSNLETALSFLTGDIWQLSFRAADSDFFQRPRPRRRVRKLLLPKMGTATAVCLFSGGLDSLTGAINLLEEEPTERVLLIGHYDASGPRSQQVSLFAEIGKHYPLRSELLQTRVSHRPKAAREPSLRSRSLVFMALGIYAARSSGLEVPLYAPENGLIALNVPLTPSRAGSCSTRTMHPFFLSKLASTLQGLGFSNRIINPFALKTKGECIVECFNQPLLKSIVSSSVSCSHGTRRQHWIRKGSDNCGYCMPCLFRRAALHSAGLDRGRSYGIDVCDGELPLDDRGESSDDLRAVVDFLHTGKALNEIARDVRAVAPLRDISQYTAVVERGFNEVRSLFHQKAKPSIKRAAGIIEPKR